MSARTITFDDSLDHVVEEVVRVTAADLGAAALRDGPSGIGEKKYMKPALLRALTSRLGASIDLHEPHLRFKHWQGLPGRKLGGIDIAVRRKHDDGYGAFMELKWGDLDWAILDFFKMTTARVSPGADACYVIAGEPEAEWVKPDSVGELFQD